MTDKQIKEQTLVNRAIAAIKKQLRDLEKSRKKYIAAAVVARESGIASQYNLAKNAIRIVTAQKVAVEQMLMTLELSAQIKDMSELTLSFAKGMKMLSGAVSHTTDKQDFQKVTERVSRAVESTRVKQNETDIFLDTTQAGFAGLANRSGVRGDDVDALIDAEISGDGGLDAEIADLERIIAGSNIDGDA